jgi:hypothetical protein
MLQKVVSQLFKEPVSEKLGRQVRLILLFSQRSRHNLSVRSKQHLLYTEVWASFIYSKIMVLCKGLHQKRGLEHYRSCWRVLERIAVKLGDFTTRNRPRDKDLKLDRFVHKLVWEGSGNNIWVFLTEYLHKTWNFLTPGSGHCRI